VGVISVNNIILEWWNH